MFNYNKYKSSGNPAIDLVANIVCEARAKQKPLKAIHLKPLFFDWFKGGVEILNGKPLLEDQGMQFDSVNIEKGTFYQSKMAILEYYEK